MIADVASQIIGKFADCLRDQVANAGSSAETEAAPPPQAAPVSDPRALAGLLSKAESDPEFLALLDRQCGARVDLFRPEREREAWRAVLAGLARGGDFD